MQLGECGHVAEHRSIGVGRHGDDRVDFRGDGVGRQRVAGIALRRHGPGRRQPERLEPCSSGHNHAAVFERECGIRRRSRRHGGRPSSLHFETATERPGERMIVSHAGRVTFAEGDDRFPAVAGVPSQSSGKRPPNRQRLGRPGFQNPSRPRSALRRARIEHNLHRPLVDWAEIHGTISRIRRATGRASQVRHKAHRSTPKDFRNTGSMRLNLADFSASRCTTLPRDVGRT